MESEPGEERRERDVRQGGKSEVREWKVYGFSWEVLRFDDFTDDFSWEVLKFTISTSHFMRSFEHLTKKVTILWCVLRATGAKYCKIHRWFSEISDSMVQKHRFWASPRRGTDGRTDGRRNNQLRAQPSGEMHENKFKQGLSKSDREWFRVESEPGEERRERNVRQVGQSEVREWKVYGFSREVLIFD